MSAKPLPDKPTLDGIEAAWAQVWEEQGTYRFDRTKSRAEVFSIDTPPPTVSGSLHVGHVFSYTHTDCIARYKRMRGFEVFYPMGWDDNGLPTERRVQNYYGVRCDPSLPYDPAFAPPAEADAKHQVPISRKNFVELCERLLQEAGVAALPGACFGMPERSMYVRFALVDFDGARAIEMSASAPLDESFLRAFLKPTYEAVKAVRRWVQGAPP